MRARLITVLLALSAAIAVVVPAAAQNEPVPAQDGAVTTRDGAAPAQGGSGNGAAPAQDGSVTTPESSAPGSAPAQNQSNPAPDGSAPAQDGSIEEGSSPQPGDRSTPRPRSVRKIYRDYRDDGAITACDHSKRALQRTLDDLPPEADVDTPDLRPALEAAIEQVEKDECEPEPTPTPTPDPDPAPDPVDPVDPPAPPPSDPVDPAPEPDLGGDEDYLGGAAPRPPRNDKTPEPTPEAPPELTPVPPAATPPPAPTPTPAPAPVEPSGSPVPDAPIYRSRDGSFPVSLLVFGGLIALTALVGLLYTLLVRLGVINPTRWRRDCSEAIYRLTGTWGDFADWVRTGR